MTITKMLVCDASTLTLKSDLVFTDPPYNFSGKALAKIIDRQECDHLVLLTSMSQFLEFAKYTDYKLNFDFVINSVVPKKSNSIHKPNYTHVTCVYMTRNNAKSKFNRKLRMRSDCSDAVGYWSTVIRAARNNLHYKYAKNINTITDILGSFEDVKTVIDLFAGSGSVAIAASELGIHCTLVELDEAVADSTKKYLKSFGIYTE